MYRFMCSTLVLFLCLLTACKEDVVQGRTSIVGNWQLTEASTYFPNTGIPKVEEQGNLGQFVFDEDSVIFSFTRNDTLYQGSDRWYLLGEKVNDGFFKVNEFTLAIENHFTFRCRFGDETRNAEKDATQMTLSTDLEPNPDFFYILSLEKD